MNIATMIADALRTREAQGSHTTVAGRDVIVQVAPIPREHEDWHLRRRILRIALAVERDLMTDAEASQVLRAAEACFDAHDVSSLCIIEDAYICLDTELPGSNPIALHHRNDDGYRVARYTFGRKGDLQ